MFLLPFPRRPFRFEGYLCSGKTGLYNCEAVGSCTDLTATVVSPLKESHSDVVEAAGFMTLVDARRILDDFSSMNLSHPVKPSEVFIFHQWRESSVFVLSKTDLLNPVELEQADHVTSADKTVQNVEVVLNVRAACAPDMIEDHVASIHKSLSEQGDRIGEYEGKSLIPSPPEPY